MQAEAADFQAYFKSWAAYYGYTFQPNTLQVIIHERKYGSDDDIFFLTLRYSCRLTWYVKEKLINRAAGVTEAVGLVEFSLLLFDQCDLHAVSLPCCLLARETRYYRLDPSWAYLHGLDPWTAVM